LREVRKMKRKMILISVLALLMLAATVAPAMAIGPWQASDVGNNKNLFERYGGVVNSRGEASGSMVWAYSTTGGYWVTWKWRDPEDAKGLMNNAIIVVTYADMVLYSGVDYENKWIYLSGEGVGDQFMGHGWVYWLFFVLGGPAAAASAAASFPRGALWMHNNIYASPP
jgi:hypothetical protein